MWPVADQSAERPDDVCPAACEVAAGYTYTRQWCYTEKATTCTRHWCNRIADLVAYCALYSCGTRVHGINFLGYGLSDRET